MPTTESAPKHGDRGDAAAKAAGPRGLTLAVSREAGSRGGSVARRVGELLGWPVYDREAMDLFVTDESARQELLADLPADAPRWADAEFARLVSVGRVTPGDAAGEAVRLMLAVAARGEAVLVGRAAGFVLPAATTLHVRVVAPAADRVAYFADGLRLSPTEAAAELARRDAARAALVRTLSDRDPADPCGYDLVVNASRLGAAAAAAVIAQAVRARHQTDDPSAEFEPVG